ncbi:MAG: TldD/PmbA family protein [Promethearchaeota archaeon]|jgi:PmbA protein
MQSDFDVFNLANHGLKIIEQKAIELKSAEIFIERNKYISIEIEENSVKNSETGEDIGIGIRVINKTGALGFAFSNKLEEKTVDNLCKIALKMMNVSTPDPDFYDLPYQSQDYPQVNGLFDPDLKNLQLEDSIGYINTLIELCEQEKLAISQSGSFISNYSKTYIFNSNGLEVSGKDTSCSLSSHIIVKDKSSDETSFGYEWQSERNLKKLDASNVGKIALEEAKRNLNRKKIKSMKVPIILTPKGTIQLILRPIASAINAETFQYRRSYLVDKRDEIIGTKFLNIDDNGLIDGAVGSANFDGEGVPCKNKRIFEKGKFLKTGLLHNSYTAGKEGVQSTGNAARHSYSSIPSIGVTNFIQQNGDISFNEMIKDVKKGIIFDYTGDTPNISTGDFSGLILHGNLILNGEIKEPLNETMIGINLLDLYKKIDAVSKEFKIYGAFQAPYVRVNEVQIIGGKN